MSDSFTLADSASLDDLQVFLARAARIEDGSVRLIAGSGVLAVYAAVLYPVGLLDESPTVLGLRTVALGGADEFDVVVPIRSLEQRLERARGDAGAGSAYAPGAREPIRIGLPMAVNTATWAAISPPRGGWRGIPAAQPSLLDHAAREGIAEVAATVPDAAGEQIVRRVRAEVWGRPIPGLEHVPAGAGFAALSLGFLGDDDVRIYETGPWTRLSTHRGHVLVKRKAWTLAR
ncbi:MAG TPA: hypothetical protein VN759_03625 [Pseudolysinimonas sp.]|nr:hypothetical protein [Pseudolysinimonas sp.]